MHFHISDVLHSDRLCYVNAAKKVNVPVLFLNGERDEYTSASDAKVFADHVQHSTFSTLQATGHFLDMEHKAACRDSRDALRSEEHTSELQSLMRTSYAVFSLKKKKHK